MRTVFARLGQGTVGLLQVIFLAAQRLARELDCFFQASDVGAHRVEPSLPIIEGFVGLYQITAPLFDVGLETNWAATWYGEDDPTSRWQLAEIEEFVTAGDQRLDAVQENLSDDLKRLVTLGAYARTASNGRL